ncbi:MAG: hypothetical protein AB1424_17355 [Thermodesulfobacteriota bacterium]
MKDKVWGGTIQGAIDVFNDKLTDNDLIVILCVSSNAYEIVRLFGGKAGHFARQHVISDLKEAVRGEKEIMAP